MEKEPVGEQKSGQVCYSTCCTSLISRRVPLCTVSTFTPRFLHKICWNQQFCEWYVNRLSTHSPGALNWHLGGGWPCDLMRRLSHRPGALNWHLGGGWTCCSELRTHPPPRCHPQLTSCGSPCAVCRDQFPRSIKPAPPHIRLILL